MEEKSVEDSIELFGEISEEELVEYSVENEIKSLMESQILNDITFIVGEEKIKCYGHKAILSLASPVFQSMFLGDLKETSDEIVIPDLTPIGFTNLLKYVYGYKVSEFDLSEFYETYIALDKYLVKSGKSSLIKCINSKLNVSNCFLIYDQLIDLPGEILTLNKVREFIQLNSKSAFESDNFIKISQSTLADLLQIEGLDLPVIDILKAISRWVNGEVLRKGLIATNENKQLIFQPIKCLINLSDLSIREITKFDELDSLLDDSEVGKLFLNLRKKNELNPSNFKNNLKDTLRKCCTFSVTGRICVAQKSYHCNTCGTGEDEDICVGCVNVCHKDHDVRLKGFRLIFCDCGANFQKKYNCKALVNLNSP